MEDVLPQFSVVLQADLTDSFLLRSSPDFQKNKNKEVSKKKKNTIIIKKKAIGSLLLKMIRPKWPTSTKFGNNWARNTVSEIIREVPPFVVLELTKLEYPIFFIHVAPDHQHLEFKKTDWYPSS